MSIYTSLSGLQASQTDMAVISNNLANVATNGFKKSRTDFADVFASSVSTSPTMAIGSGTRVSGNVQQFGTGNMTQSTNTLDMAISGDGFFAVKPDPASSEINYTRNGAFSVDAEQYVVDASGNHLQVYPVDGSGSPVATGLASTIPLKLPATSGVAVPTSAVSYAVNLPSTAAVPANATFNRFDASTYNNSTSSTVYDANGNALTMTTYFRRDTISDGTSTGTSTWSAYSFIGDKPLTSGGADHVTMTFDNNGVLTSGATTTFDPVTPSTATTPQTVTMNFGTASTQLASPFSVASPTQNGAAIGQLTGVTVKTDGLVQATFSNGDVQNLGKVAIVNFANPAGLRQLGSTDWAATGVSGEPVAGAAGLNGMGKVTSGMIEGSNVDITEELVNLIAAQRNFQANAKALDTAGQLTDTIVNIRT